MKIKYECELTEIALAFFLASHQYTPVRLNCLELMFLKQNQKEKFINSITEIALLSI